MHDEHAFILKQWESFKDHNMELWDWQFPRWVEALPIVCYHPDWFLGIPFVVGACIVYPPDGGICTEIYADNHQDEDKIMTKWLEYYCDHDDGAYNLHGDREEHNFAIAALIHNHATIATDDQVEFAELNGWKSVIRDVRDGVFDNNYEALTMYGTEYTIEENWVDITHSGDLTFTADLYENGEAFGLDPLQFHRSDEDWSNMMREYR
jgi:hypothetical protein